MYVLFSRSLSLSLCLSLSLFLSRSLLLIHSFFFSLALILSLSLFSFDSFLTPISLYNYVSLALSFSSLSHSPALSPSVSFLPPISQPINQSSNPATIEPCTHLSSNVDECVPWDEPLSTEHLHVEQGTLPVTVAEFILKETQTKAI